eukprot:5952184-Pyramimonas_sp.AAC.1
MIRKLPGVMEVVINQCEFGLSVVEGALSRKSTRVMTNDPTLFRQLSGRQCRGGHEHHHLEGGHITRKSQYPPKLCKAFADAVLRSIQEQESHLTIEEMAETCSEDLGACRVGVEAFPSQAESSEQLPEQGEDAEGEAEEPAPQEVPGEHE